MSQYQEEEQEDEHSLEAKFAAAVKVIRSLPEEGPFQASDDMMLMFYSYYKQATEGPCNIPRPVGFWDTRGKIKWDAWSSLGNMTKEEAMKSYIEHIQLILETIPISDEVTELVQQLGDFYTEVEQEEENEVDERPFTRPFAEHAEQLGESTKKPTMEGYGDLWDDIQNLEETDRDSNVSRNEPSKESRETGAQEDSVVWRCEERLENWNDIAKTYQDEEEREAHMMRLGAWSPDQRLLMVSDHRWSSDTKGSSSSVEPSMSSFTNGAHSSLNSQAEDEELVCSIEPSVQYNLYAGFNGQFSDYSSADPERSHRTADSDNEEFCDSMEHLAMEKQLPASGDTLSLGSAAASVRHHLWSESKTTLKEAEDEILTRDYCTEEEYFTNKHNSFTSRRGEGSPPLWNTCSATRCVSADAACGYVSRSTHPVGVVTGNICGHIAAALVRLQHDMDDVQHRLHTLELLARPQSRLSSARQENVLPVARKFPRPSWWPFDCSPLTVVLTAFWPLITHGLIQLYLQRRRRSTKKKFHEALDHHQESNLIEKAPPYIVQDNAKVTSAGVILG